MSESKPHPKDPTSGPSHPAPERPAAGSAPTGASDAASRKSDALQLFAEGASRDLSNALTVINGYAGLLSARPDLPEDARAALQQIYAAAERATAISRRMLLFGRAKAGRPQPADLNAGVRASAGPIAAALGKGIALDFELAADLPPIAAEPGLFENLLVNLAYHSRDAMRGRGRLVIGTWVRNLAPEDYRYPPRRPGRFVGISVHDSGPSLPPDLLTRAFEPFAVPRRLPGDGHGLSLAVVGKLAAAHDGWAEAEAAPDGGGTVFHVFLPALSASALRAPALSAAPVSEGARPRSGETVLLVEDEAPVREFARSVLQSEGYRVLQAANGRDALETWKWHGERIQLLITDLVLPDDFDGLELVARLQSQNPALPALCTSGLPPEALGRLSAPGPLRFLPKPYAVRHLAEAAREMLDQA